MPTPSNARRTVSTHVGHYRYHSAIFDYARKRNPKPLNLICNSLSSCRSVLQPGDSWRRIKPRNLLRRNAGEAVEVAREGVEERRRHRLKRRSLRSPRKCPRR